MSDALFAGGGAMRAQCRAIDWDATQLGSAEQWPAALRNAASLCLDALTPMAIWAGPELTLICNDAYANVLGEHLCLSQGRTMGEVLPDPWASFGNACSEVLSRGRGLRGTERLPQSAHARTPGAVTELSYSLSPIRADDGRVVGVLHVLERCKGMTELEAAREQLAKSHQRLHVILESVQDDFVALDREWRFVFVSRGFAAKVGKTPDDFVDKKVWDIFPEHAGTALEENFRAAMEKRETRRFELRGKYTDAIYQVTVFPSADGITMLGTEITAQKRLEETLREASERYESQVRLFESVASTTPDFVYIFDRQGRFVYANRRLLEVWGMQLSEAIGKTCLELGYERWHHDMHMREIAQVIATKLPIKGEVPFTAARTGIAGTYEYIFTPVKGPDGEVQLIAGTTRDVTERRQIEDELRRIKAHLEEADRRKDHFLAVLSHELRNPLTPIKNSLHLLTRAAPEGEQARRAKEVIARQIDLLSRLVDDLLDVTRISRGKIQLQRQRVELNDLVRRTVEDHRPLFESSGIKPAVLTAAEPLFIDADVHRIAQVISNLLQNAAKFTPHGGSVTVTVSRDAAHEQALVRVTDTGAGMKPELLARLFEPFMQADETLARSQGGLGLGLALAKGLVVQHGGSIEAKSEGLGRGAELIVRLPLDLTEPAQRESPSVGSTEVGRRVLVIEDNIDAADSLKEVLELEGHEVVVVYDGSEALAKALQVRPDLILCDIGLPGMDGYAVARAIRSQPALVDTPLIALSGYARPEDLQRSASAGFSGHLAKPPSFEKLTAILATIPARTRATGAQAP